MDKNKRIETLHKAYLKRWDKDPLYMQNCNIYSEEVGRDKFMDIYTPYNLLEFRKELNSKTILEDYNWEHNYVNSGTFADFYGDFLLKRNFSLTEFNDITTENVIDYCHFLLKHKGKLHNTFGEMYYHWLKVLNEIVDTDIVPENFLFEVGSIRFMLRWKYDKRLKKRNADYESGILSKRNKKKIKFDLKKFSKVNFIKHDS